MEMDRSTKNCIYCRGSGSVDCSSCNGTGYDDEGDKCTSCKGSTTEKCSNCKGTGQVEDDD